MESHSHEPTRQIDAGRVIRRLQSQRAELNAEIDMLSAALEEAEEKVDNLQKQMTRFLSQDNGSATVVAKDEEVRG